MSSQEGSSDRTAERSALADDGAFPLESAGSTAPVEADQFGMRELTDARAIRALAHPVRMALLELLAHMGTMTATQASEVLDESPANCAFHLRTLAKYGFVEEAGGGRGRERPWRRSHSGLSMNSEQGSPAFRAAARALEDQFASALFTRARTTLADRDSWPAEWRSELGATESICYLTLDEAREFQEGLRVLFTRFADRIDHPERRPAGALPVEVLAITYPLLHLPPTREET